MITFDDDDDDDNANKKLYFNLLKYKKNKF